MKTWLNDLFTHRRLDRQSAKSLMLAMTDGEGNDAQVAGVLAAFRMRPVALEELQGFRDALLDRCLPVDLGRTDTVDVCGTGGDGKNTFNISTLAAFVVAGAGYAVTKHGNYGVSSACGSSNVLEALGLRFSADQAVLRKQLNEAGICFLHAPMFHPALARVAPIRRALGVKTIFNMLGPLVNPARPSHQLAGVFSLELARLYQYLFEEAGTAFCVVHSLDGYDELSLTGAARVVRASGPVDWAPRDMGLDGLAAESLFGGDTIPEAAAIFREVLAGEGPQERHRAVLANAALAIGTYHPGRPFTENFTEAKRALLSGKAAVALERLVAIGAEALPADTSTINNPA